MTTATKTRPFTIQCAQCSKWAECDWFESVEALEDLMEEHHDQEVGWSFLRACFKFHCYDYVYKEKQR